MNMQCLIIKTENVIMMHMRDMMLNGMMKVIILASLEVKIIKDKLKKKVMNICKNTNMMMVKLEICMKSP